MKVMPRNRALTVLTDDLLIKDSVVYFKSPCFRALNIRDNVKGYARKLHPKGYFFIADETDGRNFHNGCSVLVNGHEIQDILWFKEVYNKITILEGFYI